MNQFIEPLQSRAQVYSYAQSNEKKPDAKAAVDK